MESEGNADVYQGQLGEGNNGARNNPYSECNVDVYQGQIGKGTPISITIT